MTDLEALSEAPVPRPDHLARRFARRIHPTLGFALYGFLYAMFVANTVGIMPVMIGVMITAKMPDWFGWFAAIWYIGIQIPLWALFRAWVRRKRSGAMAIVRDGKIVTASLSHTIKSGSRRFTMIAFGGVTVMSPVHLGEGQHCKVLFLPGAPYCFVFAPDGTAIATGIGRGNPYAGGGSGESNVEPLPQARVVE